jgi:molybdopterin converting factor small subunit
VPVLRLFAAAREAAGEARLELEGATVQDVLEQARSRFGQPFGDVLERSRVWVNGQPAPPDTALGAHDVVAVLPPVSGGAAAATVAPEVPAPPPAAPQPAPLAPAQAAAPPPAPAPPPSSVPEPDVGAAPEPPPALAAEPVVAAVAELVPGPEPRPEPEPEPEPTPAPTVPPAPDLLDLSGVPVRPTKEGLEVDLDLPPVGLEEPAPAPPPPRSLDLRFEPGEQRSADDLLDRLAKVPPFADPVFDETKEAPPEPREDESLWAPGRSASWSVGEPQAPAPPEPAPPDEGERPPQKDLWGWPPEGREGGEGLSPQAPPAPPPADWDRRWDPDADAESGAGKEQGQLVVQPPGEPAVRILGPETVPRPLAPPVELSDDQPVRIIEPEPGPAEGDDGAVPAANGATITAPRARGTDDDGGPATALARPVTALAPAPSTAPAPVPSSAPAPAPSSTPVPAPSAAPPPGDAAAAASAPAAAPEAEAVAEAKAPARPKRPPLAVVPKITRPHGRLGFLWVGATVACVIAGEEAAGVWFALIAGIAGLQTARVWRARNEKPMLILAAATSAVLPLCAILGLRAVTGAVAGATVVTLLARLFAVTKAPGRDVALTLAIGVVIGLAAASVVLLRNINVEAPLLLLAFTAAYDAGAYLVGTGASSVWEGPAAGVATLIPVTMLAAVILVPPFPEGSPLVLGAIAALLAPCGPLAGSALLGERDANAPALRRLDSLLVVAPVWAWCAAAFLR